MTAVVVPERKPLVYVAGPYSSPDPVENTHLAVVVANRLIDLGFSVILPHITLLWHAITPKPYQTWLDIDLQHVMRCDAVYRFTGASSGADGEVAVAEELGIPVFYEGEEKDLVKYFEGREP